MKVIGTAGSNTYLCEINHTELEKFMGLYYRKLGPLKVGDVVDLGKGHDHSAEIKAAMNTTRAFIENNSKIVNAIINGLRVETILADTEPNQQPSTGA